MNRHNIPEPVEREIRERDTVCVYCHAPFGKTRKTRMATWEHLDAESVEHPTAFNVTLCYHPTGVSCRIGQPATCHVAFAPRQGARPPDL